MEQKGEQKTSKGINETNKGDWSRNTVKENTSKGTFRATQEAKKKMTKGFKEAAR